MEMSDPEALHELEDVCRWCGLVFWVPNGVEFPRTSCCPSIVVCFDCAEDVRV